MDISSVSIAGVYPSGDTPGYRDRYEITEIFSNLLQIRSAFALE
jgi:hypothetical protein